jgi:predicted DNA-binding transcriptional regulator AlpA
MARGGAAPPPPPPPPTTPPPPAPRPPPPPARCWDTALTEASPPDASVTRRTEHPAMAALLELLNTAAADHARHLERAQLAVDLDALADLDPATVERIAYVLEHFDATPLGQAEAADRLGVPRATVDRWIQRGVLPPETWIVGGRRAWATSVIDIWALLTNRAGNLVSQ